jgi:large subunit ribosomal protein L22
LASTATAKNTGISVTKVRRIINLVRGLHVEDALDRLRFQTSPVAKEVSKLVSSAVANAENEMTARSSDLIISEIYANEGTRLKRFRARARGRAARIAKLNSHITVVVDEEEA